MLPRTALAAALAALIFAAPASAQLPIPIPSFEVRMHWHPRHEAIAAHRWVRDEVFDTLSRL